MAAPKKFSFGILALGLALALAGCAARAKTPSSNPAAAKPAVPTTPSAPVALSIPQTQAELPKPQPIDPAALAAETTAPVPAETPTTPRPPVTPPRRTPATRTETGTTSPVVSAEPARQPVQEVIPAADLKRFQDAAQNRKREVTRILGQLKHPTKAQQSVVSNIRRFVSLSDEAEKRNDMRQADALAERAQILARDLQHGK
jgi:hypothetical protein